MTGVGLGIGVFCHSILAFYMFISMGRKQKGDIKRILLLATINTGLAKVIAPILQNQLIGVGIIMGIVFFIEAGLVCEERMIGRVGMSIATVSHTYVFLATLMGCTAYTTGRSFYALLHDEKVFYSVFVLALLCHGVTIIIYLVGGFNKAVNQVFEQHKLIKPFVILGVFLVVYSLYNTNIFEAHYITPELVQQQVLLPVYILSMYYVILFMLIRMLLIDAYQQKNQKLEMRVHKDALTGLLNKTACIDEIQEHIQKYANGTLMLIDIDNFKGVNDNFGHQYGDDVLKRIAEDLKMVFPKDAILSRWGGDEYIVFIKRMLSTQQVEQKAKAICECVKTVYSTANGDKLEISASLGIAIVSKGNESIEDLFDCADKAMYQIKEQGKGGYLFYDHRTDYTINRRLI